MNDVAIERLDGAAVAAAGEELASLLADAVAGGASVGFARPPSASVQRRERRERRREVEGPAHGAVPGR